MKWILFFLINPLSVLYASKELLPGNHYYSYDNRPLKITKAHFHRYVIPSLRMINAEYYTLLKKLHPAHQKLVSLKKQLTQMRLSFKSFKKICPHNKRECSLSIKKLYHQSQKLDKLLLSINQENINFYSPKKNNNEKRINSLVALIHFIDQITVGNYEFMHTMEEFLITTNTRHSFSLKRRDQIELNLDQMISTAEIIQTFFLEEKLRKEFDFAWSNFLKPIEEHLIDEKRISFLLQRLEDLNMAWNTFHMAVAKGGYDLSKETLSLTATMHNRWNSILKIILTY